MISWASIIISDEVLSLKKCWCLGRFADGMRQGMDASQGSEVYVIHYKNACSDVINVIEVPLKNHQNTTNPP